MNAPRITTVDGVRMLRCGCGHVERVEPDTFEEARSTLRRHAESHARDRYRQASRRFGRDRCPHNRPAWSCFECYPLVGR